MPPLDDAELQEREDRIDELLEAVVNDIARLAAHLGGLQNLARHLLTDLGKASALTRRDDEDRDSFSTRGMGDDPPAHIGGPTIY